MQTGHNAMDLSLVVILAQIPYYRWYDVLCVGGTMQICILNFPYRTK